MEQRRNKFAYDSSYYRDASARYVSRQNAGAYSYGNAARKLELMSDPYADEFSEAESEAYEELYAEPLYRPERRTERPVRREESPKRPSKKAAPQRQRRAEREREAQRRRVAIAESEPKVRYKKVLNIDFTHVAMLFIATIALVFTCYKYLDSRDALSSTNKQVDAMVSNVSNAKERVRLKQAELNVAYDPEYVFSYAVERLGMVYPNKNTYVNYTVSDSGYVRQYKDIPEEADVSILSVIIP